MLARPFDLHQYTIQNYIGVIYRQGLGRSFLNSLLISVPATFLSAFVAAFAAFGFAWMRFPGRRALFMLVVALIYLGATPNVAPVTLTVANLVTNRGQNWELLTAAAFVSAALPLVVFFSLQRYFVRGILAGSIKE